MISKALAVTLVIAVVNAATLPRIHRQGACGASCRFTFEGVSGAAILQFSEDKCDVAISSRIVLKDCLSPSVEVAEVSLAPIFDVGSERQTSQQCTLVGSVDHVLEALVLYKGSLLPISQLPGPSQAFSPSFLKVVTLPRSPSEEIGGSAVSHECPQGNQSAYLDGLCAVLPLGKWQELSPSGTTYNINGGDETTDCVAFTLTK
uniref:Uncharacterized protein n=1 Tax=Compsopogon caeruleus TaxID=31354 RepID=A0A7S1XF66_9RHOD|mmetsp:Transcript_2701/g.4901  ORF Transcript_2701/g.4901 Transcript_2701/m.4901 type:complete len:204 (+) Transcript_2701:52-663(+)